MAFIAPVMAAMSAAAPALSLAAGAIGAIGSIQQGNAAAAAANYNARVQDQQAQMALNQAAGQTAMEVRKNRQVVAASQAGALENGVELTGSTLGLINQARDTGTLNALLSMYDGSVKATGFQNNARLDRMQAKSSQTAGYIGAATNMLGGVSDYYQTKQLAV